MVTKSLYEELVDKYDIDALKGGSDFDLDRTTGSLKMNRHGSLKWRGKAFDAMFNFVRSYEIALPKLKQQFLEFVESYAKEEDLVQASSRHAEELAQKMMNDEPHDGIEMHALSDAKGAVNTGRELNAASIVITLNTMLQDLQKDLEVSGQKFENSEPKFQNQSFGKVILAASNNARHASEWRVQWVAQRAFTVQQLKSVEILAPVLGRTSSDYRYFAGEICAETLAAITGKEFELFEKALFVFAKNLAAGVENNR